MGEMYIKYVLELKDGPELLVLLTGLEEIERIKGKPLSFYTCFLYQTTHLRAPSATLFIWIDDKGYV